VPVGASRNARAKSPLDKAKGYEVVWKQVAPLFDAARAYGNASFVYVIGEADDGPIKIGVSKDPISRLRTMQTGNPRRLRIEYVLMGDTNIERLLHELWEPFAIFSARTAGKPDAAPGTEWFTPDTRKTLLPIVATASTDQVARLKASEPPSFDDLEVAVRDAHAAHGFVAHRRHEVRLLAAGSGYLVRRPSRI
jgi:hypothetical protein